jgi:hypothetical protein
MSQPYRLAQLPLVGAFLLCMLIGVYLFAAKRVSKPEPVKHSVDTSADDVLKYWTTDKMRKARPARMPNVDAPEHGKKPLRRSSDTSDAQHS